VSEIIHKVGQAGDRMKKICDMVTDEGKVQRDWELSTPKD